MFGPGLAALALAYVLSQFFRAFLAVLAEPLAMDIGATPEDLATGSGLWFLCFAAMQIPVGEALDRVGPRRTAALIFFLGGSGGAAIFAMASAPWHISLAMALIGIGCSPVLMASYFIFARNYLPQQFATLAALLLGFGLLGNLLSAYPTTLAVKVMGWRGALIALSAACAVIALAVLLLVKDPEKIVSDTRGSVIDLLKMPVLWTIIPLLFMNYVPAAAIRGLWIGPYLNEVYGLTADQVGQATLLMAVAMIVGTLIYGPLDRLLGTRKWVIFTGNAACAIATLILAATIQSGPWLSIACIIVIGMTGATFPVMLAHGRGFCPPHLTGRAVTLFNLFAIGGVGVMQFASGRLHTATSAAGTSLPYAYIFAFFGVSLAFTCALYLFSRDTMD